MVSTAMLQRLKDAKNKYAARTDSKVLKIKEGKTTVRILTGAIGSRTDIDKDQFWRDVGIHWIKEDENGKPVAVVGCHDVVHGQPCPTCNAIERAGKGHTDDETLNLMKSWKSRKAVYVVALIRSGADASEEPQILELTSNTFADVAGVLETYTDVEEGIDPLDPKTGIDLIIERTGKGKNDTRYKVIAAPKSKPVPPAALENLPDLDAYIQKEHFRGEDNKAVRAIGSISGVSVTGLEAPARGGLLTSKAATVEGADELEHAGEVVEAAAKPAARAAAPKPAATKPAAAKPAPAPGPEAEADGVDLNDDEMASVLGELDGLLDD